MLKAVLLLLFFVAAMTAVVGLVGYSSCDGPPVEQSEHPHANQSKEHNCAAPYATLKVGWYVSWAFVHEFHEEIIALGTIIIACFTIILGLFTVNLAGATDRLVRGAEKTAEMQLRAYIHTIGRDFLVQDVEHERFVHRFRIVNVGQTPAYKLRAESITKPLPHPLPANFDFTATPKGRNPSVMMLGPRRRVAHDSFADTILSPNEMAQIMSADSGIRLYSYGTISYETFGEPRYTNFCYFLEWEVTPKGLAFNVHPSEHHNDAN